MSAAPPVVRNPLGLPAGSVRSIIALVITGSFVGHLFSPEPIPLYIYFLLALVPPFFTAHGTTIAADPGGPSPLHLPRGTIRVVLSLGIVGATAYFLYLNNFDYDRLAPPTDDLKSFPIYLMALGGGLFAGFVLGKGPWRRSPAFQDIQAWLSILALLALAIELVIDVVIRPQSQLLGDRQVWNTMLLVVLSFYYASRS
jgi:hypothetical protein